MDALHDTIDDIWWGDNALEDIVGLVNKATNDFASAYTQWAQEIVDMRSGGVRMDLSSVNELADSFKSFTRESGKSIEDIAQTSSFTIDQLRSLKSGKTLADPADLKSLSEDLYNAHDNVRSKAVETLCDELRAGINTAEATRIEALLQKSLQPKNEADDVVAFMSDFRNKLIGDK